MKINPDIFRAYDIRGIADKDLNPEIVELIGKAFGTYLLERGTNDVLVGRDTRSTSEGYQKDLVSGLISTGCNIFDMGIILSSMLYFARQYFKIDGGVMITASHNPPEWNGFKLCHGVNAIVEEEIQKVKNILLSGKFKTGNGERKKLDVSKIYFDAIKQRVKIKKPLKVVIDGGNATPSLFIPQFLAGLGCEPIPIRCNIDPTFPGGLLDPVKKNYYQEMLKKIKETRADLGILLDGDGDRVGFADEKGNIWLGDIILLLLIRKIIPQNQGRKVIVELKDSEAVAEETKRLGGIPIFWKTGHALLDQKVFEEKAILCGEMSCHFWITDNWYYFDDALHALAKVLEIISSSEKEFSEIIAELPRYESTPEYRITCPEDKKFELAKELVEYFKNKCDKFIDIDGIRGYIGNGWFLLRPSNTQPVFVIRAEAKTVEGLETIKKLIKDKLDEYSFLHFDWRDQS